MQKKKRAPWWNRESFAARRANLEKRSRVIAAIRAYFAGEGFTEVETPALQVSPGLEPHLHAFSTVWSGPAGEHHEFYLHTSPEFAMKKLLAAGAGNIFQLASCYRNREKSNLHHPEFTMLEWYRVAEPYTKIMDDCGALLQACAAAAGGDRKFKRNSVTSDPFQKWERLSVQEAFLRYTEIDLLGTIDDPARPSPTRLRIAAEKNGVACEDRDAWDDIFFRIFLNRIETKLGVGTPTILYDYPISMAALARPKRSNPDLAERFEVYVCGLELANAFGELTDAKVQRARFAADMEKKDRLYGYRYPIDEGFLEALDSGYPESSGIALGVDRLVMLACGAEEIEDVLWAPVEVFDGR